MLNYIEYLNVPTRIAVALVVVFLVMQIIGEILEFKGKVVPEALKIRKHFARVRREREMVLEISKTLEDVKEALDSTGLSKLTVWISEVNSRLDNNDKLIQEIKDKLDKNNSDTLSLLIDSKRNTIIEFASYVVNESNPVTREQFNRVIKLYMEYEDIIKANGMTNGEVDIAYTIIKESYEKHMMNHTFIEDIRGYTAGN